jgi:hypothetical protein
MKLQMVGDHRYWTNAAEMVGMGFQRRLVDLLEYYLKDRLEWKV